MMSNSLHRADYPDRHVASKCPGYGCEEWFNSLVPMQKTINQYFEEGVYEGEVVKEYWLLDETFPTRPPYYDDRQYDGQSDKFKSDTEAYWAKAVQQMQGMTLEDMLAQAWQAGYTQGKDDWY